MTDEKRSPFRLLDTKEAAEVLNVGYDWLKKRVATRQVPHTKIGRYVRFSPEHIQQIILAGEQSPLSAQKRGSARTRL
jgi:excisionase family DNA binding protein